jgi:hypothetical protein
MSRFESWLETDSSRSLDDAWQWLISLPNWKGNSGTDVDSKKRCCQSDDGVVTACLYDYRVFNRGSAESTVALFGTSKTLVLDINISRKRFVGRLDDMFELAFGFAKWDESCNLIFRIDDGNDGVFIRRNGRYLINPHEFYAKSLAEFLRFPFDYADPPCRELTKAGWCQAYELHNVVGEQSDAPKSP